ncbi:MAG: MFS transporter, partial [Spirochaetaceae bacterium]|nr:MFS transporter [Spirochaetaceae bacterium]
AAMFLFGFLENIKGVSYPLIKNEFGVSYETQGKMLSILSFSYTLFVAAAGFMLGRFGIKKTFLSGLVFTLLSLALIYFMPGFLTVGCSLFVLFAGFGVLEIAINGMATQLFIKKAALMMNLLHFMYGAGSVLGPKTAGMLANPAGPGLLWRQIYLLTVPLVLVVLIPSIFAKFSFAKFPALAKDDDTANSAGDSKEGDHVNGGTQPRGFIAALKTPSVWAFGITLGVMVALEMASANWGGLYFQDLYGMDPTTKGANFVSAFFILFTLSRLVSGFLIEKIGYMRSLTGAALIIAVIFMCGFALGAAGIYVLPLLGFFLAILWPTVIAVAIGRFGSDTPVMTSAIITIAGLLNSGIQLVMGYINRWIGPGWGYRSCLLFALLLIGLLVLVLPKTDGNL